MAEQQKSAPKIPEADPDSMEEQQAAANAIPPEPLATDPPDGPVDDSWRHPEPAEEPKGYAAAVDKEHKEAQAENARVTN